MSRGNLKPDPPELARAFERMRRNLAGVLTIAVTGTKGKTSTCEFIGQLIEASGLVTAVSTTESARIGSRYIEACENGQELYAFVAKCRRLNVQCLVVELCSSALKWNLHRGFNIDVAVLTNIGTDHIKDHGNRRNYVSVKKRLFSELTPTGIRPNPIAILNGDDRLVDEFMRTVPKSTRTCLYGLRSRLPDKAFSLQLMARGIRDNLRGTSFRIHDLPGKPLTCLTELHGDFNVSNILAAVGCCIALGMNPRRVMARARNLVPPRGRFEIVVSPGVRNPAVIVDYAHTPESFHGALTAAHRFFPNGLLHAVFGCGGDTYKAKRALMGKIAARIADTITLTTDNPRLENPIAIVQQIRSGVPTNKRRMIHVELDRLRAIETAIGGAHPGDVVVILGKGNEQFQEIGGRVLPFSDRRAARFAVDRRSSIDALKLDAISAILIDERGRVRFSRNPDLIHPPASVAKLMTLYLAFEAIAAGDVQLSDRIRLSTYALLTPHGKLGRSGKTYSLRSLLKAAAITSDNSAATAVAEHVGGDEASFIKEMNRKCRELGLISTRFATPHGLPHRNQQSDARDLARLIMRLFRDHPDAGKFLGRSTSNSARFAVPGTVLGFKTGYTAESGYNLAVAAEHRGQKLFAVTLGSTSRAKSFADARKLLRSGFTRAAFPAEKGH